jgi:hypothetical protein
MQNDSGVLASVTPTTPVAPSSPASPAPSTLAPTSQAGNNDDTAEAVAQALLDQAAAGLPSTNQPTMQQKVIQPPTATSVPATPPAAVADDTPLTPLDDSETASEPELTPAQNLSQDETASRQQNNTEDDQLSSDQTSTVEPAVSTEPKSDIIKDSNDNFGGEEVISHGAKVAGDEVEISLH